MFPKNLLIARARKESIKIAFLDPGDPEIINIADSVYNAIRQFEGMTKRDIDKKLNDLEDMAKNFKVVRGFKHLLYKKARFVQNSPVKPELLRRELFKITPEGAVTEDQRNSALKKVADIFYISREQVEKGIVADIEDNFILKGIDRIDPVNLVKQFNLEQIETVLAKASYMEISVSEGHRELISAIKRAGLIYSSERGDDEIRIIVDGPLSLLRYTEKYGYAFISLIPFIVSHSSWSFKASVQYSGSGGKKMVTLELDESSSSYLPVSSAPYMVVHDKRIDDLVASINHTVNQKIAYVTTEPVVVNRRLYYPDLVISYNGLNIYVDILHYWTVDYIKKRDEYFSKNKMILLTIPVSTGNCDKSEIRGVTEQTVTSSYILNEIKNNLGITISPVPGIAVWPGSGDAKIKKKLAYDLLINQDIIDINTVELSKEEQHKLVKNGYVKIENFYIKELALQSYISKIDLALPDFSRISSLFSGQEIDVVKLLRLLGYRLKWESLNMEEIRVERYK